MFFRFVGSRLAGSGLALSAFATFSAISTLTALPAWAVDRVQISAAQRTAAGIRVETLTAGSGSSASVRLQGYAVLPPQAIETVSVPVSGFVQSVLVAPTDVLRAGQAVATVRSAELMQWQREYIQLDVQAQQAKDRLARSERLLAEGIVAESRVRDDRYTNAQAQIAVRERRQSLQMAGMNEARLRGLSDQPAVQAELSVSTARAGTVIEVMASAGQRLEAGAPLIKLARSGLLALELQATPAQSESVQPGATVKVAGCAQPGRVRGIASLMRGGNQAVTVHVDMPPGPPGNTCLRANQTVDAEVSGMVGATSSVSVATSALFQHGGKDHVFVQDGEAFVAQPVQVVSRTAERALIGSGVKPGQRVATQGIVTLKGAWLGMGEDTSKAGTP